VRGPPEIVVPPSYFRVMAGGALAAAIDSLAAAVDALLGCELSVEPAPELAESFARLEVQRRRLVAVDHRLVAELRERGIAGEYGRAGTCLVRRWRRCSRGSPTRSARARSRSSMPG